VKIQQFTIENFRGIARTVIAVQDGLPGNVTTLVGLNESGKTTILDAIGDFVSADLATSRLVGTVSKRFPVEDVIPKHRKAAFTGDVSIGASIVLEDEDVRRLAAYLLSEHDLNLYQESVPRLFTLRKAYKFNDSQYGSTLNSWSLTFKARAARGRSFYAYDGQANSPPARREIWIKAVQFLNQRLPKIVYFPTFLFNPPARIYLEGDSSAVNEYYKQVFADILEGASEGVSLQKHIIDRLVRLRKTHAEPSTFLAFLFQRDEKQQIDAVLHVLSQKITQSILGGWREILGKSVSESRVQVDWGIEPAKENAVYLEISVVDKSSKYRIADRSLGFRWFFSFILFTQFRHMVGDGRATIFLFDEPAANLHSRAQMQLLKSFARIAQGANHVIYSTHSHYMINPLWLERAYIVENKGLDLDKESDTDFVGDQHTVVEAVRYRAFLGSYPNKTTYFQPILDALKVGFSPLVRSSKALIVEGKNDYHALIYLRKRLTQQSDVDIFPGGGAGNAGELISIFRGWGVTFRILLDDDRAGRQALAKYRDQYCLSENEAVTVGLFAPNLAGKEFEAIYGADVKALVTARFGVSVLNKRHYSMYFQELLLADGAPNMDETLASFGPINRWIDAEFA